MILKEEKGRRNCLLQEDNIKENIRVKERKTNHHSKTIRF